MGVVGWGRGLEQNPYIYSGRNPFEDGIGHESEDKRWKIHFTKRRDSESEEWYFTSIIDLEEEISNYTSILIHDVQFSNLNSSTDR